MSNKALTAHYTSSSDEWGTPTPLFSLLNAVHDFALDAAASPHNAKCPRYLGPGGLAEDALQADWLELSGGDPIWLNAPYSKIAAFMAKAHATAFEIVFLKGRLKFNDGPGGAPFPSALVVFAGPHEPGTTVAVEWWDWRSSDYFYDDPAVAAGLSA